MSDAVFNLIGIVMGAAVGFGYLAIGAFMYRKARASEHLNRSQRQIISLQIIALLMWTTGLVVLTIYSGISPHQQGVFQAEPTHTIIIVATSLLLGFIALTSMFSGVSIVYFWFLRDPLRGNLSRLAGLGLLIIVVIVTTAMMSD